MEWSPDTVRVRVPATSANLGPGFDALGLALWLHDAVEARVGGSGVHVEVSGEGEHTAAEGEGHLVVRAMRATFARLGGQPPGIALRCVNRIPHGRGLGSSAAAIVSGILAARALVADSVSGGYTTPGGDSVRGDDCALAGKTPLSGETTLDGDAALGLATEIEGHPDNVAACLLGGLTVAWYGDGGPRATRLTPLRSVRPVVCVAANPLRTEAARRLLPDVVPHADAAANSGRAALLVAALTADPDALFDATQDFLHQRYRASAMPQSADLIEALRAAGIPAVVSGAGPSVLALCVDDPDIDDAGGGDRAADAVGSIARETGTAWRISLLDVDLRGASTQTVTSAT